MFPVEIQFFAKKQGSARTSQPAQNLVYHIARQLLLNALGRGSMAAEEAPDRREHALDVADSHPKLF